MFDLDEDDRETTIDNAIKNNIDKEIIKLYEHLEIAIELLDYQELDFRLNTICNNAIHYIIAIPYPNKFPENLALIFFNIDTKYDVQISEINNYDIDLNNNYFNVFIKPASSRKN